MTRADYTQIGGATLASVSLAARAPWVGGLFGGVCLLVFGLAMELRPDSTERD